MNSLIERIKYMGDDDLVKMLTEEAAQYTTEALSIAKLELLQRDVGQKYSSKELDEKINRQKQAAVNIPPDYSNIRFLCLMIKIIAWVTVVFQLVKAVVLMRYSTFQVEVAVNTCISIILTLVAFYSAAAVITLLIDIAENTRKHAGRVDEQ